MTFQERYQYNPQTDLLGKGGFARVYKAKDTLLGRIVALKFFVNQTDEKHTLIAEISKAIQLEHPNLCRYYDAAMLETKNVHGEADKTEVGVLEYLDGGDLKTFVRQHPEQLSKLLVDVLQGLDFLHENGIIHRDLKTQNILIKYTPKGPVAKITDFGISKLVNTEHSNSSALMGTIEYMAPEQFNPNKYGINGKIATNVDLWSFGVMVYELVVGEGFFGNRNDNTSAEQVMSNILGNDNTAEKISKLPEPYKTIVQICLVKDAGKRVQKAADLIVLLEGKTDIQPYHAPNNETMVLPKQPNKAAETWVYNTPDFAQQPAEANTTTEIIQPKPRKIKWLPVAAIIILLAGIGILWPIIARKLKEGTAPTVIQLQDDNITNTFMVLVQGGDFSMGSNDGDSAERPSHPVEVSNFYISKYEITVAEFKKFVNESKYATSADQEGKSWVWNGIKWKWEEKAGVNWRCGSNGAKLLESEMNKPVVHVSYSDAVKYCEWKSKKSRKKYRLPTEAEWEYAAKGGDKEANKINHSGSNNNNIDESAWFRENSGGTTHPVGQKKANELGLCDMAGNVSEWCSDWYDANYYGSSTVLNPQGASSGTDRVVRGYSWYYPKWVYSPNGRQKLPPINHGGDTGFRTVVSF